MFTTPWILGYMRFILFFILFLFTLTLYIETIISAWWNMNYTNFFYVLKASTAVVHSIELLWKDVKKDYIQYTYIYIYEYRNYFSYVHVLLFRCTLLYFCLKLNLWVSLFEACSACLTCTVFTFDLQWLVLQLVYYRNVVAVDYKIRYLWPLRWTHP